MIESPPISNAALDPVRAETPAPNQARLSQCIRLQRAFSRSINLARDGEALDPIHHYQPTSRALEALRQILPGLSPEAGQRALALIGPYGAGKSAFGLFLGALLGARDSTARQIAHTVLKRADAELAEQIRSRVDAPRGFLRVQINGLPDSLSRQLLLALAAAVEREGLPEKFVNRLQAAARAGAPMDQILNRVGEIQTAWAESGGAGAPLRERRRTPSPRDRDRETTPADPPQTGSARRARLEPSARRERRPRPSRERPDS